MGNWAASCPESDVLESLAAGVPAANNVTQHLDDCAACRAALQRIRDNNRFLAKFAPGGALPRIPVAEPSQTIDIPGYEIQGEIHRGGQGVVYHAVQKSTKRDCAVKVMKHGPFATSADRARFDREVSTLGMLEHPNIVAVRDAGAVAGCQYFVMDYVDGWPLDEAFDADGLTLSDSLVAAQLDSVDRQKIGSSRGQSAVRTRSMLRVFIKVCDAVHAAHLRGVIHRDLKPSNVRVDHHGEPHVLDFGLAKSIEPQMESAVTQTGQFLGSLPWASPEQVEGASVRIDLRTDVYSLGAILYQLLTGQTPFDVGGSIRETLDSILLRPPPKPSALASSLGGSRVGDELDTIVLKCLAKNPDDRYQSAGDLSRDLRRYLAGEPIEAKRDSALYVLRKALQRYRMRVAVAAVFAVLLAAFTIALAVMYRHSARLEREAVHSADSLSEMLGLSNIEKGRMAGLIGNMQLAEQLLWGELLIHRTAGDSNAVALNSPPKAHDGLGGSEVYWALLELYRRFPCIRTIAPEGAEFFGIKVAEDGHSIWTTDASGSVRRFDSFGAKVDAFQIEQWSKGVQTHIDPHGSSVFGHHSDRLAIWRRDHGSDPAIVWTLPQWIAAMNISASGRLFAFVLEGEAIVMDGADAVELGRFRGDRVNLAAVAISNDDRRLAGRAEMGDLYIWDIESGRQLSHMRSPAPFAQHTLHSQGNLLFSPDDQRLADAWMDTPGRIWNLAVDPPAAIELSESSGDKRVVDFSPEGNMLAVGDMGGVLRMFDTDTGRLISSLIAHSGRVRGVAFCNDHRTIWTCGDHELRRWDIGSASGVRKVPIDREALHTVSISADGLGLLTGGGSGRLHSVDVQTLAQSSHSFGNDTTLSSVAIAPNGRYTAAATYANAVFVWDDTCGNAPPRRVDHPNRVSYVSFDRGGESFATACDDFFVRVWRTIDGSLLHEFDAQDRIPQVVIDPSGRHVAAAVRDGSVRVWNIETGDVSLLTPAGPKPMRSVRYSADGKLLIAGGADRLIRIWSTDTLESVAQLEGHNQEILCVDITPSGELIASGDSNGTIRVWDAALMRPLAVLEAHDAAVMSIAFSSHGGMLASASLDGTLCLWELDYCAKRVAGNLEAQLQRIHADQLDAEKANAWRQWARSAPGQSSQ